MSVSARSSKPPNAAAGGDCRRQVELVAQALQALPVDEILAFHRIFDEVRAAAYQVDLWGAASLVNDGCSADGFEDFRGWLISRGRSVYEAALRDADSLASLPEVTGRRHPDRPRLECRAARLGRHRRGVSKDDAD